MRIRILGQLAIEGCQGAVVRVGSERRRTLLTLLASATGDAISPSRLAETLWEQQGSEQLIHVLVARTRAQLAQAGTETVIETVANGYRLRIEDNAVDAVQFKQLLIEAADGDTDMVRMKLLSEAIDLWRDHSVVVKVHGSGCAEIDELTEQYWRALTEWSALCIGKGMAGSVVAKLQRVAELGSLSEQVWANLLTALHREGRSAEAEMVYRRCRALFRAELGIEPGNLVLTAHSAMKSLGSSATSRMPETAIAITPSRAEVALRAALTESADYAIETGGYRQAALAYRAVLDHGQLDPDARPLVLLRLGEAMYHDHSDPAPYLTESVRAFLAIGDRARAGQAQLLLAKSIWLSGGGQPQKPLAVAADLLDSAAPADERTTGLASVSTLLAVIGERSKSLRMAELALRTALRSSSRQTVPTPLVEVALRSLGTVKVLAGDLTGLSATKAAVRAHRERHGWVPPVYLVGLADQLCHAGELATAARVLGEAAYSARHHGAAADRRWIRAQQIALSALREDHTVGPEIVDLLEVAAVQPHYTDSMVHTASGALQLSRGAIAAAVESSQSALSLARAAGDFQLLAPALALHARAMGAIGDLTAGRVSLDEFLAMASGQLLPPEAAQHLGVALQSLGRPKSHLADAGFAPSPWLNRAVRAS